MCIVLVLILAASCSYNIFTPEVTHIQLDIKAVIDPNFYKLDNGIYTDVIMTEEDKKECVEIIQSATDISKQLYHDDYVFIITDEPIKGPLELKDNYEIAGQTNNHKKMITLLRKQPNSVLVQYVLRETSTFTERVVLHLQVNSASVITDCLKMRMYRSFSAKS